NFSSKAAATTKIQVSNLSGFRVINFIIAISELQEPNRFTSVLILIVSYRPYLIVVPPPLYTALSLLVTPITSLTINFNTTYNLTVGPTYSFLPPQLIEYYNFPSLGTVSSILDILVLLFPIISAIILTFF
ncbi:hypothetical protein V2W45_1257251, partial [Cenococcum geophilum]